MGRKLTLKEHQKVMLSMMIEFDQYCEKKGLTYFLAYGTLLGAVRHNGFIPWDDDVDILMPRPDYEKLLRDTQISDNTDIVSYRNPKEYYHPFCASVLADKHTIMKEKLVKKQTKKGVFCDIFPLDGLPENKVKLKVHLTRLRVLQSILAIGLNVEPGFTSIKNSIKTIISMIFKHQNMTKYAARLDKLAKKYNYKDSNYVLSSVAFDCRPYQYMISKDECSNYKLLEFEGYKFHVPIGYKEILARWYGDYMKLPDECDRISHHRVEIFMRE